MAKLNQSIAKPRRFVRIFHERFADLIREGRKTQTIRKTFEPIPKPGDLIDCRKWEGQAYQSRQQSVGVFEVKYLWIVEIEEQSAELSCPFYKIRVQEKDHDMFAKADGFDDWCEMVAFFRSAYGLPFKGFLLEWGCRNSTLVGSC